MEYCPRCGRERAEGDRFCAGCGFAFSELPAYRSPNTALPFNVFEEAKRQVKPPLWATLAVVFLLVAFAALTVWGFLAANAWYEESGVFAVNVQLVFAVVCLLGGFVWNMVMELRCQTRFGRWAAEKGVDLCDLVAAMFPFGEQLLLDFSGRNTRLLAACLAQKDAQARRLMRASVIVTNVGLALAFMAMLAIVFLALWTDGAEMPPASLIVLACTAVFLFADAVVMLVFLLLAFRGVQRHISECRGEFFRRMREGG